MDDFERFVWESLTPFQQTVFSRYMEPNQRGCYICHVVVASKELGVSLRTVERAAQRINAYLFLYECGRLQILSDGIFN